MRPWTHAFGDLMRRTGRTQPGRPESSITGVLVAAGAGIAFGLLVGLSPTGAILAFLALAAAATTILRPRLALFAVIALVLLEGALRKWAFPGLQQWLYFGKDGLLALLGIAWLIEAGKPQHRDPVLPLGATTAGLIIVFALYVALELVNPRNPSLAIYAFGLRTYLLPLVLIPVVPWLLDQAAFERAFFWLACSLVPLGALAILQSQLSPTHILNTYPDKAMEGITFGAVDLGAARVASTFSFISGFTGYLVIVLAAIPWLFSGRGDRRRLAGVGLFVLGLICIVLSGSRAPFLYVAVGLPIITLPLWRKFDTGRLLRVLLLVLALAAATLHFFAPSVERFTRRATETGDTQTRLFAGVRATRIGVELGGAFGWGPGTSHQSRTALLKQTGEWGALPPPVEEEPGRIATELGVVGLMLWYGFRIALVAMLMRWALRGVGPGAVGRMSVIGACVVGVLTMLDQLILNVYFYVLWAFWVGGVRLYRDAPRTAPPGKPRIASPAAARDRPAATA